MKILEIIGILLLIIGSSYVFAEGQNLKNITDINVTLAINNTSVYGALPDSPEEFLMDLAFSAKSYALDEGKDQALIEFGKKDGRFTLNESYVMAYDTNGVLLADPMQLGEEGNEFIQDAHDSGVIRELRDIAVSGGGLYQNQTTGRSWFVMVIDGSWWIATGS